MRTYVHCDHCQAAVTHDAIFPTILGSSLCARCALHACVRYVRDAELMEREKRMAKMAQRSAPRGR